MAVAPAALIHLLWVSTAVARPALAVGPERADAAGLRLWYQRPAPQWDHALPVGNSRLAAMVFGGVRSERVQLNEDSLWMGGPRDTDNPEALAMARRS